MSEADKIFEELGYIKTEFGKTRIIYSQEVDDCIEPNVIIFELKKKYIRIKDFITKQKSKAINLKCKELNWYV